MAKAKKVVKSSSINKNLETALEKLAVASAAVEKSVSVRVRDAKKLTGQVKRLAKRKTALNKRKRLAAARVKKAPSKETRQALRQVVRDLDATNKELTKARATKATNAEELAILKVAQRRTKGYTRAIGQVDRGLASR